ncbi:MAG: hypothetical protein IJ935_01750 [Afipia sp.]|nr:hypothetical protein [Afipia sp.]
MSKLITQIKRLALALCFVTPLVSWAATTVGYEDFGDVAGVVLWRATQTTFHNSTVADVAADGTVGDEYAMLADQSAKSWKRFASNQTVYSAPGMLLVYDKASSDDETPVVYTQNSEPDFGPLSFGGLWVQTLAANDSPFKLADGGSRATEFGNASYSGTTLFKFDKSFTIDRQGTFSFLGTVNLAVAQDAVFTINPSYPAQSIVVPAGSTLVPTGAGTITLNTAGLTVNGTLDLTASTLPTISGNVRFASGSSLVLPEGIATGEAISVAVCSGTLTADGVVSVKIGTADPINAALTISGGTITQIDQAVVEETFTNNYPTVVPAGYIYTFTTSAATTLPDVTVKGTLKTEGDFTITDLKVAASGTLDVVSGNTTVGGAASKQLSGNITVRSGATLTNTLTDSLDYNGSMTVDIYGTLAMGATRWSIPDGCTFKVHGRATVTGTGDSYGVLDFLAANDRGLDVYAASSASSVTIEGAVRVRNNNTRIWVASGTTLVLQSGIVEKNQQPGSFKQTGPGTLEICATQTGLTGTSTLHQGTLRLNNTTTAIPLAFNSSAALEIVATDAATTVPVNVTSINGNGVTLTGNGKANGTITKTAAPSGDLATFLQSSAWEGTFVADWAGASATHFDINSYGNANSTVRVTKLVGGYVSGSNANFTVVPTVEVSGFMTLDNGYSGKVTTLTKLTGSGVFTNKTYSVDVTTLDNFTGTLATLIGTQYVGMKIGTINLSATPAAGAKIVNITSDSNIGNIGNTKVSVNGVVDDTIALEVKSDGIYVVVPVTTVDITIPEVDNATVSVTADGVAVTPENGVVTVDIGAAVVVTYTSTTHEVTNGTIEFTASEAYTVDVSGVTTTPYVASIVDGASYTSLQAAFDAATNGKKIVLLANEEAGVTLPSEEKMVYFYAGELTHGEIANATGNYITTVAEEVIKIGSENVTATKYRVQAGWAVVTIGGTATMYAMADYAIAFEAANAGGVGTTVKFLDGQGASYAEYLPAFTYDSVNDIYVLEETPVAAVYSGVSQLGTYTSIDDAIAAVDTDGLTVKLLDDVDVVSTGLTFPADKTITFDLNGYTLTAGNGETSHVQVNGVVTITDSSEGAEGQIVSGENGTYGLVQVAENNTQEGAALTIAGGTIEAYFPDTLNGSQQHPAYGVTVKGKGTVFNMTGGKVKAGLMAVMGHGNKASAGTYTISGGTIESVDDFAMYLPTKGGCSVTISGGTFVGKGGICVRAGTLNVTGGTFTASGTGIAPGASAGTTGASFAGLSVWPNYGVIDVTISGGAFTSATGVDAVVSTESDYTASISLTGGAYSTDPSAYVAFGYKATETAGTWTVAKQPTTPPETPKVIDVDTTKTAEQQQADADAIAQDTVVTTPNADVAAAVSAETYDSYFTKTAVKVNEQWTVQTALNEDVVFPTEESDYLTADLADVLDVAAGADVEITTAKPGLYYSIEAAENVGFTSGKVEGVRELATTTTVSPAKPAKTGDAVFFRVKVSATPNNN